MQCIIFKCKTQVYSLAPRSLIDVITGLTDNHWPQKAKLTLASMAFVNFNRDWLIIIY